MYNANNYGYNPYGAYMPQRSIQQPLQQPLQTSAEINRPFLMVSKLTVLKL